LLLDNSLMLERLHTSFKEAQLQGTLMQRILDHLPVGVALLDGVSLKALLGNACLDRMLGRPLDKDLAIDRTVETYRFLEPGTERLIATEDLPSRRAAQSQKMETSEVDILQPSGERLSAEATAVPIVDENGAVKNLIILLSDLTARKRAEHERTRLQEEIIRVQAAALAERSSPLIPITDEILVLPLIGSIDTERGHQVLDTVLQGTSQRGAKVAIIDITGVRTVDTQAASALTNAAQALRLLGVDPVLTGIRPEVAQTLVSLGVRLEGIVTRSTLQSGIQYALKRLNKRAIT
jgi:anti-anti-sigma regulatory factor